MPDGMQGGMPGMPGGMQGMPGGMSPGAPPGLDGGPASAPMSTPQENEGLKKGAHVSVMLAVKILQQQLPIFDLDSDEGKSLMKALKSLSDGFGKNAEKSSELFPSEIMQMLSQVNKPPSPGAAAMAGGPPGAGGPPPGMGMPG